MSEDALAPELVQVLDRAQRTLGAMLGRSPESLPEALAALELACAGARGFLDRSHRVMDRLTGSIPEADPRHYVLEEARRSFERSRSTLDAMLDAAEKRNLPVLQGTIAALEESLDYLHECGRSLQDIDRESHAVLPFPILEQLVGAVRTGATGDAMNTPLTAAVVLVARLQRQVRLFAVTHPQHAALAEEAAQLTAAVGTGLGALADGLETGSRAPIGHGLEWLTRSAWPLAGLLTEMDTLTSGEREFSRFPALEQCFRYLGRQEAGPSDDRSLLDRAAVERVEVLCQLFHDQWQAYRRLPLAFLVQAPLQTAERALGVCLANLAEFRGRLTQADAGSMLALCTLRDAADETRMALRDVRIALQEELARTESLPRLEILRERIGRLLQGTISSKRFLLDFSAQAAHLEHLLQQARAAGPQGHRLATLLEEQRQGFERLSRYFDDPHRQHLISGWRMIEQTLPGLQMLRRTLPEHSSRPRGLSDSVPALLVRLTDWRSGVERGTLSARDARHHIKDELRRLKDVRQEARSRFSHLLKTGAQPAVQAAMQNYLDNMSHLLGALELMEAQLGSGAEGGMHDGFERARSAIMAMEMELHQLAG